MAISNNAVTSPRKLGGRGSAVAWGHVTTDGAGNATAVCYKCTITAIGGGFSIQFDAALADANYAVVSGAQGLTPITPFVTVKTTPSTSGVAVLVYDTSEVLVSPATVDMDFDFAVFGR